jgi:glycosyltransferase involved in cell wall biosynthesis
MASTPSFSIVTTVFKKEKEINFFLEAALTQNYNGIWEVIVFNDASPDKAEESMDAFVPLYKNRGVDLTIIKNEENLGQCICRNVGVQLSKGDIIIIIDSDCIMDSTYLANLARLYSFDDCDVVIGPQNIETRERDINIVLAECRNELTVGKLTAMQDPNNKRSFVNCITRNFSVKKSFITEDLFDAALSHRATDPTTGFGWDDVEMGYRLYKKGARIKYSNSVYTVHINHPPSIEDHASIPLKSMKNYRIMHEKHPEMKYVTRWWSMDTYEKVKKWASSYNIDYSKNEDYLFLQNHFKNQIPYIYEPIKRKRLKILTYCWHLPHQYELHKLPHDFTLITDLGTHHCYRWGYSKRPFPDNDTFKKIREINVKNYDLAILHFDENCLHPEYTNNVISENWGLNFKYFVEKLRDIPKIGICHGTPQFYGAYTPNYSGADLMQVIEPARQSLVNYLKDVMVICNSHQAEREWGFHKSRVIWHGFDPAEFPRSMYHKKVMGLTNMLGRPHYRGFEILNVVNSYLPEQLQVAGVATPEPKNYKEKENNDYAFAKYRNYVDAIREYSIYLNPTVRSPMPRSRTEAMMCGLVTVSYKSHDVDMFIRNGVNGFYSDSPKELAEYIIFLSNDDSALKKVANESYKTAIDIFNNDRYMHDWQETIFRIVL